MQSIATFEEPEQIKRYGRMIQGFNRSMKAYAAMMQAAEVPEAQVLPIAGKGPYNGLPAKNRDYIYYGKELSDAARHDSEGLFGAFGLIHLPEVQMYYHAPKLLAKQGCYFDLECDGEHYRADLSAMKFGVNVGAGEVTVTSDTVFTHPVSGRTFTLPAGSAVMRHRTWAPYDRMVEERGIRKRTHRFTFSIRDAESRTLDEKASAVMLWGHLQAHQGLKRQGEGSPLFTLFFRTGVDDDFTAERYLVEWLQSVKEKNGIDLMPEFNQMVARAAHALANRPDLLLAMSKVRALTQPLKEKFARFGFVNSSQAYDLEGPARKLRDNVYRAGELADIAMAIDEACFILGLALPEVTLTAEELAAHEPMQQYVLRAGAQVAFHALDAQLPQRIQCPESLYDSAWLAPGSLRVSVPQYPAWAQIKNDPDLLTLFRQGVAAQTSEEMRNRARLEHRQLEGFVGRRLGRLRMSPRDYPHRDEMMAECAQADAALKKIFKAIHTPQSEPDADLSAPLEALRKFAACMDRASQRDARVDHSVMEGARLRRFKVRREWPDHYQQRFYQMIDCLEQAGADAKRLRDAYGAPMLVDAAPMQSFASRVDTRRAGRQITA